MNTPIRAVAYYRKSNDDEGELGTSIAQQRKWAVEAAEGEGVVIVAEFEDQSVSGLKTKKRPDFQRMIAFCQEQEREGNPIEAVLCWAQDRFGRVDSIKTSRFVDELRDVGVSLMFNQSDGWIDFNNPNDRAMFNLRQEFAAHKYSRDLSAATLRGKRLFAEKGHWLGGKPPFGYTVDRPVSVTRSRKERTSGKLIPHPEQADVVKWMFETYANTDVSLWGLVEQLRSKGVRSPIRTKKFPNGKELWLSATVAKVLRNPIYLGDAVFGRANYSEFAGAAVVKANTRKLVSGQPKPKDEWTTVPGAHPALIDRETFDLVQTKLAGNAKRTSRRKTAPFILSGLLVCGKCGRRMITQTNHVAKETKVHKYRLYTCATYHTNGPASGCARNTVEDARMLAAVVKKLAKGFGSPDAVTALKAEMKRLLGEAAPAVDGEAELNHSAGELDRKIGNLVERLADDLPEAVLNDVREKLKVLSGDREKVRGELTALKAAAVTSEPIDAKIDRLAAHIQNLADAVKKANPASASALLRGLIDRIEVFFTTTKQGKRTRAAYAHALIYLNGSAWTSSSLLTEKAFRP